MNPHLDARTGIFDDDEIPRTGTCLWQHGHGFYATDCGAPTTDLLCDDHDDPDLPGYAEQLENIADWPPTGRPDPFLDD